MLNLQFCHFVEVCTYLNTYYFKIQSQLETTFPITSSLLLSLAECKWKYKLAKEQCKSKNWLHGIFYCFPISPIRNVYIDCIVYLPTYYYMSDLIEMVEMLIKQWQDPVLVALVTMPTSRGRRLEFCIVGTVSSIMYSLE